jgi:hypothetical protein
MRSGWGQTRRAVWVLDKIRDVVGATNLMPQRLIINILMEGGKIVSETEITTLDATEDPY